jgi:hypothetical protein
MALPGETFGAPVTSMAPLIPAEARLRYRFETLALEELRRGVLQAISGADPLDQRIRGVLLTANQNDFVPVFADLLVISPEITREVVAKRRRLFNIIADLEAYRLAGFDAIGELRDSGMSDQYGTVLETRYTSSSPQYRLSATCAILLFGSLVFPKIPDDAVTPPIFVLSTETPDPLKTESDLLVEV